VPDDDRHTLDAIEERIRQVVKEAPSPVNDVAFHLVSAGGKRVRPRVVVHASRLGDNPARCVVEVAAAAELVHTASLLHDDVIDEAPLRRGQATARTVWGNAHSVLAGDHLMVCALELLEDCGVPRVLRTMLTTMRRLVHAEVVQLAHRGKLLPDMDRYYQVIRGKTAALFSWCADAGARAGGADEAVCHSLAQYGEELGVAFQLCDDLLDLAGTTEELGKSLFTDISQGVSTLPVILAAQREPELGSTIIEHAQNGGERDLEKLTDDVKRWVEETGAAAETRTLAGEHIANARAALEPLADRPERAQLEALADSMLRRRN